MTIWGTVSAEGGGWAATVRARAAAKTTIVTVEARMAIGLPCGMAVVVRPFHANDAAACGAIVGATPIWQRVGLGAERAAALLAAAAERGETVLVVDDGVVSGFAWIDRRGGFGRSAYLRMIAVEPARRSSGLGARLMDAFETVALTEDGNAFLMVSESNADARRFYERRGYVEVGRVPGYVQPDVVELVLRKRVGTPSRT